MANKTKEDALMKRIEQETGIVTDPKYAETVLKQIAQMQAVFQKQLKKGTDFGVIPGTKKPTLFKPGAEKAVKLLGCADLYFIEEKTEDWDKPFFYYQAKCRLQSLKTDKVISEGIGSCNSMEDRYRWRWLWKSKVPKTLLDEEGKVDADKYRDQVGIELITKKIKTQDYGWQTQYRFPNDDIFTLVNTIQKMAKKRALIDAALSAARLSDLFTQDLEDIHKEYQVEKEEEEEKPPAKTKTEKKKEEAKGSPATMEKPPEEEEEEEKEPPPADELQPEPIDEDMSTAINNLMNTLATKYNRDAGDLLAKVVKKVKDDFGVVVKRVPEDFTMDMAKVIIGALNKTIQAEHEKQMAKSSEEPL